MSNKVACFNGAHLEIDAKAFSKRARAYLYQRQLDKGEIPLCDVSVSETQIFISMEKDEVLRPLLDIIWNCSGYNTPDCLDDVHGAIRAVYEAGKTLAAEAGSEYGAHLLMEKTLHDPLTQLACDEYVKTVAADTMAALEKTRAYVEFSKIRDFDREYARIRRMILTNPHAACCEANILHCSTACRALQRAIVHVAMKRVKRRIWLVADDMGSFPLVDDKGNLLKRVFLGSMNDSISGVPNYSRDKYTYSEDFLEAFFDRGGRSAEEMLIDLPRVYELEEQQHKAVVHMIVGYHAGDQEVVNAAFALRNELKNCSAVVSVTLGEIEKQKTEGREYTVCRLIVGTRNDAEIQVSVKKEHAFYAHVKCAMKRQYPQTFSAEQETGADAVFFTASLFAKSNKEHMDAPVWEKNA